MKIETVFKSYQGNNILQGDYLIR